MTKIVGATLGLAMAIGVGVGVASNQKAKAVYADATSTWAISSTNKLDTAKKTGTFDDSEGNTWTWTSDKNPGNLQNSNTCQQIGSNGNPATVTFSTSDITETVRSVSVACASYQAKHTITIEVGDTTYLAATATPQWTTVGTRTGEGSSTGTIVITFTPGASARAMYIQSITVDYGNSSGYTVSFNSNGGSPVTAQTVSDDNNTTATEPANPTKAGYDFVGWYDNESLTGSPYSFDTVVTDDLTLFAKWEKVALTSEYSPSLTNGSYRISGEVTAITGSSEFFIQNGNNAMKIGGNSEITSTLKAGNGVDLFGTFVSNNAILNNLAYCDETSDKDETISQTAVTSFSDVTEENLYKYFVISPVQLNSGFNGSKIASVKNSSLIVFYNAQTRVSTDSGSFAPANYAADDYVSVKGVINKSGSSLGLYITYIEKLASYVVTFNANYDGGVNTTQTVLANAKAQQPADPTRASDELYDYSFGGWYKDPDCTLAYDFDSNVTSSFPLYAKWNRTDRAAKEVIQNSVTTQASLSYTNYAKEGNGVLDTIDVDFTGVTTTSYTAWEEAGDSGVVYTGKSSKNNGVIQLNNNDKKPGIVITENNTEHDVKKVNIVWDSHTTSGKSISIYVKETPYSAVTDLYNADESVKGTCVDTVAYDGTNTRSSVAITGSYKYIGIYSNGATCLSSIEVQLGTLPSYTYENLGIRFGGKISDSLWTRLASEETVEGFGVLLSTATFLDGDDLKDYYDLVDNNSVKDFYSGNLATPKVTPTKVGENRVFNLYMDVPADKLTTVYVAVAYVKLQNDIIFLEEAQASAKSLAHDLIQNGTYEEDAFGGSLKYLATR